MRHVILASISLLAVAAPALALDVSNASLSNVSIGRGAGGLGHPGLDNSASISGSRITATNTVTSTFSPGVNLNPDGNGGIGGVATGFSQTTRLSAGGEAIANTSLSGSGTLTGSYNARTERGNLNAQHGTVSTATLGANGRLDGSFQRTANSNAATGLSGYSGAQLNGPGSVSNTVNGSALAIGAGLSAAAGLR